MADLAQPDAAFVVHDEADGLRQARLDGDRFTTADVQIALRPGPDGLAVEVACPRRELSFLVLRWNASRPESTLVLGDAWERSYGDLQWRALQPERLLPWSFLSHDTATGATTGMGVRVRPHAFCSWTVDADGVSLWLDVRSGGSPVVLGDRILPAATVVATDGEPGGSAFDAQRRLAAAMCS